MGSSQELWLVNKYKRSVLRKEGLESKRSLRNDLPGAGLKGSRRLITTSRRRRCRKAALGDDSSWADEGESEREGEREGKGEGHTPRERTHKHHSRVLTFTLFYNCSLLKAAYRRFPLRACGWISFNNERAGPRRKNITKHRIEKRAAWFSRENGDTPS